MRSIRLDQLSIVIIVLLTVFIPSSIQAFDLPNNFENVLILSGLQDPDGFVFAPDGRLFIQERITGRLLVAKYENASNVWRLNPEPFYTFDIPMGGNGEPEARRSAGLRDIAFDPDFMNNGFIYAFYMKNALLQNRVVRIKANPNDPDSADASFDEELLLDLPFNSTFASGSHNGGALEFDNDGTLFITTGDGWTGEFEGDPVQSLSTFTGKVLRIHPDGTIPLDNPFYEQTTGSYRAIYGLGLRNPYSMSKNAGSGKLYINEARGNNKASIYVVEAGANYGHEAGLNSDIGTSVSQWADASGAGGELITGGAWYPAGGSFPERYHGGYFVALWGSNSSDRGQISVIESEMNTSVTLFEGNVGLSTEPPVKPVITRIGPDGNLYYMLTTYQTSGGTIQMVRYTLQETVATPQFSPNGGQSLNSIQVSITTSTPGATIHYTTDTSDPTQASAVYSEPITLSVDTLLKTRAFKAGSNPSGIGSALFTIGANEDNQPPAVDAGSDRRVIVGQSVALDGSGTTDPDGDDDLLSDEQWEQLSGPSVSILDATEEIAYFTPAVRGAYTFQLSMSDGQDTNTDQVTIAAFPADACIMSGLQAMYTFREGSGTTVYDWSGVGNPLDLTISGSNTSWLAGGGLVVNSATSILSSEPAIKLIDASQATNAFSVELWIRPANITQDGPARIFTLSGSSTERNLTIGQGRFGNHPKDVFDFRLRTNSSATDNNGEPSTTTDSGTATADLIHLVYTRNPDGLTTVTTNGTESSRTAIRGDLSNWNREYALGLANEFGSSRPWIGEYYHLSYYDCAMSTSEISTSYGLSYTAEYPTATLPPTPTPIPSPTLDFRVYLPQISVDP